MLSITEAMSLNTIAVYKRIRNSGVWLKWLCRERYRRQGMILEQPEYHAGK